MPHKDPEARRRYMRERYHAIRQGLHIPNKGNPRKGDDIECSHCGKMFYRSPANRLKRGVNQYCSRKCLSEAFAGRIVGEQSPRWKGRESRPCDNCGKVVTRPPWAWNSRKMTFCDTKCFGEWKSRNWTAQDNPYWHGGHPPYYGGNWKRQSREARRRDNHTCQFCGIHESELRRALDVHHIIPFRLFGDDHRTANRLANLISLCEHCHTYLERFSAEGSVADWISLRTIGQIGSVAALPEMHAED